MTSLLCVQEPGGFVEHHNIKVSEDVMKDSANHAIFAKVSSSVSWRGG